MVTEKRIRTPHLYNAKQAGNQKTRVVPSKVYYCLLLLLFIIIIIIIIFFSFSDVNLLILILN